MKKISIKKGFKILAYILITIIGAIIIAGEIDGIFLNIQSNIL